MTFYFNLDIFRMFRHTKNELLYFVFLLIRIMYSDINTCYFEKIATVMYLHLAKQPTTVWRRDWSFTLIPNCLMNWMIQTYSFHIQTMKTMFSYCLAKSSAKRSVRYIAITNYKGLPLLLVHWANRKAKLIVAHF